MISKLLRIKLLPTIIALAMITASFGSAFAVPVYAADIENANAESVQKNNSTNNILAGIAVIGLIAALSNSGGSSDNSSAKTTTPVVTNPSSSGGTVSSSEETLAFSLLNQDRVKYGLPALKLNSQLTRLAENYANDMIKRGYFSHYNPEGLSPFDRMNNAGIAYRSAGENLAINSSVPGAETAFMNSSGHRANILNSSYTEVGVGVVHSPNGSVYVVQEFIGK